MVKIVVIGWYGTETIGDRAILAGLFEVISKACQHFEVRLGSIHPTLSERTLIEDMSFYKKCTINGDLNITIFNSAIIKELNVAIRWADIVVVGGGPLMNTDPMYMLDYAFKKAKQLGKKTAILGCGMGPLGHKKYIHAALSVINHSDLVIFRDAKSVELYSLFNKGEARKTCFAAIDPAIFATHIFLSTVKESLENQVTINFREIINDVFSGVTSQQVEQRLIDLVKSIADSTKRAVKLIPMHTFSTGGDDRFILNRIASRVNLSNVMVQNMPLSLEETMQQYYDSQYCIGMRFHAILLQTTLNGRNYMLDYTHPKTGKTINLLNQLGAMEFYQSRYYSLIEDDGVIAFGREENIPKFEIKQELISNYKSIYITKLKELINIE